MRKRSTWLALLGAAALIACAAAALVLRRARGSAAAVDRDSPARTSVIAENEPPELGIAADEVSRALPVELVTQLPTSPERVEGTANSSKARFRGRLVYETTHDPVPWCIVAVRGPNTRGELRLTDADGRFATGLEYGVGPLHVLAEDLPSLPQDWTHASMVEHAPANPAEQEIALRMWPTCFLEGSVPEGVDVKRLTCEIDGRAELGTVRSPSPGMVFWRLPWTLASEGNRSMLDELVARGPPWKLLLRDPQQASDAGAGSVGVVEFDRFQGVVRASMQWSARGAIHVSFRASSRRVPDWDGMLRLRRTDGGTRDNSWIAKSVELRHQFTWPELTPGTYELVVAMQHCEPVELDVTVDAGKTTRLEVPLSSDPIAGVIRGTITSESGAYHDPDVTVDLHHDHVGGRSVGQIEVLWAPIEGRWVGSFVAVDLPSGEYQACIRARPFAVQPEEHIAARPGDSIAFKVLDRAPIVAVGFRVFERESGVELEECTLSTTGLNGHPLPMSIRSGVITLENVPENGDFYWCVSRRGYGCAKGWLRVARAEWSAEGARRWIRVELARGTGISVTVRTPDQRPIAGATIVIDGSDAGLTDERGHLQLVLERHPESIDVRLRDWRRVLHSPRVTGDSLDPCGSVSFTLEPSD